MLRNYLTSAYRNLIRSKASSLINLAGLALGISGALVLFLLIRFSLSFDRFHSKRDRIYRVVTQTKGNDGYDHTPGVPAVLPEAFRTDFPEAEEVTFTSYRAGPSGSLITVYRESGEPVKFIEPRGVVFAQPNFFRIFDRPMIMGSAEQGIDEPNEVIVSQSHAVRYFGTVEAIGKVLRYEDQDYRVTAVMEDCPANTDLPFTVMLSHATIKKQSDEKGWNSTWSNEQCYVLLREGEEAAAIEARLPAFVIKYLGEENRDEHIHTLQPLADLHFDDRYSNYNYNTVPRPVLIALSVVALFLILTACINFINLSTAEAIKRSREVGIRKALGGTRKQLIVQYLGEATLLTISAVFVSIVVVQVALVFLNPFLELSLSLALSSDPIVWLFIAAVTVGVSISSGLYPAVVVSGFRPLFAMSNRAGSPGPGRYSLRKTLVVVQFFISQFFLIGTIVLIRQMDFVNRRDLGFAKEAILSIPIPAQEASAQRDGTSKMRALREEVSRLAGVGAASLNSAPPSSGNVSSTDFNLEGNDEHFGTQVKQVDGHYVDLFELTFSAGRNVGDSDTATGFVVNEKLVTMIQLESPQDILGKTISLWGRRLPVVGVVKDFHTTSLANRVEPLVLMNRIHGYKNLSVKVSSNDPQGVIDRIKPVWEAAYPEAVFSYEFLEEEIRGFYEGSQRMSVLFSVFTSMAICIGCLGLLGLATYMAAQRTKEIGVRKVLGASVSSILMLFTREFVILVAVGFVLSVPAAFYFSRFYLDQFAYRIELGPDIFMMGMLISLFIASITVGFRTLRAATANPADSLRYE